MQQQQKMRLCTDCNSYYTQTDFYQEDWHSHGNTKIRCKGCINPYHYKKKRKESLEYSDGFKPEYTTGHLYCITSPTFPSFIKIGRTNNLTKRLRTYQLYNPNSDYRYMYTTGLLMQVEKAEEELIESLGISKTAYEWFCVTKQEEALESIKALEVQYGYNSTS